VSANETHERVASHFGLWVLDLWPQANVEAVVRSTSP
jgi:hypothetical protein